MEMIGYARFFPNTSKTLSYSGSTSWVFCKVWNPEAINFVNASLSLAFLGTVTWVNSVLHLIPVSSSSKTLPEISLGHC